MNDLEARARRRLSQRRRLFLGRSRTVRGWFFQVRQFPVRYTLHAVALLIGAGTLLWLPGQNSVRVAQQAHPAPAAAVQAPAPPAPRAQPTAAPRPVVQEAGPAEQPFQYTIQPGDTLRDLAVRFDVTVQTLVWNNDIPDPDLLRPGQILTVPPTSGVIHSVKLGETLRHISSSYNVSLEEIARYNDLEDLDNVPGGMRLVIPGGRPLPAAVAASSGSTSSDVVALGEVTPLRQSSSPGEEEPAPAPTPTPKPIPQTLIYEVQPGDTLRLLTQLFGTDLETILRTNNIDDPDLITVGTKLRVLPVSGLEHEVQEGETLADIAHLYQVDMGPILDFNDLPDPDLIRIGMVLIVPGANAPASPPPPEPAPAEPAPADPAPAPPPPPPPAPEIPASAASNAIVATAMQYLGHPYVWGGTSPAGFDCSGYVYYVYRTAGKAVPRAMWGQLNSGPRIPRDQLQPGDIVFFANTYQAGLSHNGIYVGSGQFVHASTPSTGVVVSSMGTAYWSSRYVGATRP